MHWGRAIVEHVVNKGNQVRDVDLTVTIDIGSQENLRSIAAGEHVLDHYDQVGDVNLAVEVEITRGVTTVGEIITG